MDGTTCRFLSLENKEASIVSRRLIVLCRKDVSSVNIVEHYMREGAWQDLGSDGYADYSRCGDDVVMSIPDLHIYCDGLDGRARAFGFDPDVVIFPSEHASSSGMPALTVHPIGNYNGSDLGGRSHTLVKAHPSMMGDALRLIKGRSVTGDFNICFEVTHHGPYMETPAFFLEIGSDERHWGRDDDAALQASVLRDVPDGNGYPIVIGLGGGHYAPRFTELALSRKVNFGHMVPNYQTEGRSDEEVATMIRNAAECSGTKVAFLHRKSMNGPTAARLTSLAESVGCEVVKSDCFEPLDGN